MHILGLAISYCAVILEGLLILRGAKGGLFRLFPLFYSYIIYACCGTLAMYVIYWQYARGYPSAFWIYYLVSVLVEFTVVVEISDQLFRPFPAIRHLGRAITIIISVALGMIYMLPVALSPPRRDTALLGLVLRASVIKAIILVALLIAARHYRLKLGKNVAGLILGFSVYLGVNIANLAAAKVFGPALYGGMLWIMAPLAYTMCLAVWTIALWKLAPATNVGTLPVGARAEAVELELNRYNHELSRFLHK